MFQVEGCAQTFWGLQNLLSMPPKQGEHCYVLARSMVFHPSEKHISTALLHQETLLSVSTKIELSRIFSLSKVATQLAELQLLIQDREMNVEVDDVWSYS